MSTRVVAAVTGKEIFLSIEKTGSPVIVGCASNIQYSGQTEVLTANCQAGRIKIPSGDDPDYTITVDGFHMVYASADVATNVSATEIETYMQNKTLITYSIDGAHDGDPTRSGNGYITAFSLAAPVDGFSTYNFTITPYNMPVLGTVA